MNPTASPTYAPRKAYRATDDRWLGGVASGTRPAPGPAGAVGADGLPGARRVRWLRGGAVRRAVDVPARAAAHDPAHAGARRRHPSGQAIGSPGASADRLRPAGRRRGDRDRRAPAGHAGHRSEPVHRPAAPGRCRRRGAVVAGRRGAAPAVGRPVAADEPAARHRRRCGLACLAADRARPDAADRRDRAVLAALRQPERRAQRRPRRRLRDPRAAASWSGPGCSGCPPT